MIDTKFKKYVFYSHLLFQVIILTLIGLYIGYKINKGVMLIGIFGVGFFMLGVATFIINVYRMEKKNGNKKN